MKTYKAAPTNENKGYKTHGSFKNSGQKAGDNGAKSKIGNHKGSKYASEKLGHKDPVDAKLRKVSKAMFGRLKPTNNDAMQRAQLNG